MKRFATLALGLLFASSALASPLSYTPVPLDTIQAAVASVYQNLNASLPTAAYLTSATGAAGAATANGLKTQVTTEALSTAAAAFYTETITNSSVALNSVVLCNLANGTNNAGHPALYSATPAAGSLVLSVQNVTGNGALNGTLIFSCLIVN